MLKYFAKVFLISILSGSLLFLDIDSRGIQLQAAFGASGGIGGVAEAAAKERAAANASARASSKSSAASSTTGDEDHSMTSKVKTGGIDDSNMMATLTMTLVGTLAARLYKYKMTTDIMLAAAGGAIFIGGEVLAFFKLKEAMKDMETQITRDKKGNINREQIAALERLKSSYEEAKKTANTKKMLQMAAAAAFAAAGVMAYTMAAVDMTNLTTCMTAGVAGGLTAATTALAACATLTVGAALCAVGVKLCISNIKLFSEGLMKYELARQATSPSLPAMSSVTSLAAGETALMGTINGTCSTANGAGAILSNSCGIKFSVDPTGMSAGTPDMSGFGLNNIFPFINSGEKISQKSGFEKNNYFERLINLLFPEAKAGLFSAMGIASSVAINYLLITSATLGPMVDLFMLIPQKRAIVWGILAGLTFAASSATDDVISQIDNNISKIDSILNSMNTLAKGATATQIGVTGLNATMTANAKNALTMNAAKYEDTDLSTNGNGQIPCFTGPDAKNCKSMESVAGNLPSNNLLDKNSQMQTASILKTANGFNGSSRISKGNLESAAKLAANAVAYRAALNNAKKIAQEKLKASGSKVDLDEETKKFAGSIDKAMRDGLKKSNSSVASMYSSMYGSPAPGSASGSTDSKLADDKADKGGATVAAIDPGIIDVNAGAGTMAVDLGAGAIEEKKELTKEELAAYNASTKGATSIDEFEIKNDITKDTSSSLFELISNRYQRSGYQRLFKVKEAAAATAPVSN